MEKKVIYLYPEVEGKQSFVCWGIKKEMLGKNPQNKIRSLVGEGLKDLKSQQSRWITERSFSVSIGRDGKFLWVAIPRQLSAKTMKIIGNHFSAYNPQIVITSSENTFGEELPFEPVISYDRGFIVDATSIEEKLLNDTQEELVANI